MEILLIARHYPPEISGGARRPYLLTKALRERGHKVTLVTPFKLDDPDHICVPNKAINNSLRAQLGANKVGAAEENSGTILKNAMRLWLLWPDPNIGWAQDVVKAIGATNLSLDWIMTTSPPESSHIAGARLSRSLGVPWLAEMRDTWVSMPHREVLERSKIRTFFERRMATKALSGASAITCVSEAVMDEARKYCSPTTPELVLPHFSVPIESTNETTSEPVHKLTKADLNIVHTGGFSLSDRRRKLEPLLEALTSLKESRPELVFHIAGVLTLAEEELLAVTPLRIKYHGCLPLQQIYALQRQADGLLLYTPRDSHALPGKYAEYVLSGRPILYFGSGSWLSLVEDKTTLRPLISGLKVLKKNETIEPKNPFTHLAAADALICFLNKIDVS